MILASFYEVGWLENRTYFLDINIATSSSHPFHMCTDLKWLTYNYLSLVLKISDRSLLLSTPLHIAFYKRHRNSCQPILPFPIRTLLSISATNIKWLPHCAKASINHTICGSTDFQEMINFEIL